MRLAGFYSYILLGTLAANAQGTFQNLGFESVSTIPIPGDAYGRVQFSPALPGWTGYIGGVVETKALYDNQFLDSSGIGILEQHSIFAQPINGNYTALLEAGFGLLSGQPAAAELSQTGIVPIGTQSLLFEGRAFGTPSFTVALGGQTLSLVTLLARPNSTLYGADVHNLAGQLAELTFTVYPESPHINDNYLYLDSIQFSTQPVPEPGPVVMMIGLSALIFGRYLLQVIISGPFYPGGAGRGLSAVRGFSSRGAALARSPAFQGRDLGRANGEASRVSI